MPAGPKKHPRDGVDADGRTLAWYAAASGDVASIKARFAAGENLSAGDDAGLTPLHMAAQNGQLEAIQLLITLGADTNVTDKYGNGPLEGGADPDNKNKSNRSPRDISQRSNHVLQIYLSFGASGV